MIHILLADDHALFRQLLRRLIDAEPGLTAVAEAATSSEVLPAARSANPDVILLDVSMPGRSCLEVLADLKSWRRDVKVLMLTGQPEGTYAIRLYRAGADGYVTKGSTSDELLEAIRKVHQGRKYVTPALAELMAETLDVAFDRPPHEALSARELEVATHLGGARTVSTIAEELHLSVKTVSTYRRRVLDKLGLGNNAELMRYCLQHGLVELPPGGTGDTGPPA